MWEHNDQRSLTLGDLRRGAGTARSRQTLAQLRDSIGHFRHTNSISHSGRDLNISEGTTVADSASVSTTLSVVKSFNITVRDYSGRLGVRQHYTVSRQTVILLPGPETAPSPLAQSLDLQGRRVWASTCYGEQ